MPATTLRQLKETQIIYSLSIAEKKQVIKLYTLDDKPLAKSLRHKLKIIKNDLEYVNICIEAFEHKRMVGNKTLEQLQALIIGSLSLSSKTYEDLKFITLSQGIDLDIAIHYLIEANIINIYMAFSNKYFLTSEYYLKLRRQDNEVEIND